MTSTGCNHSLDKVNVCQYFEYKLLPLSVNVVFVLFMELVKILSLFLKIIDKKIRKQIPLENKRRQHSLSI
jgi:hypothetical protein